MAAHSSPPDYGELFEHNVIRSVQAMSKRIQTGNDAPLSEQAAAYAKHVLDFGLALDAAWPFTRNLLLILAPKMEQAGHRDDWLTYLEQGIAASVRCADPRAEAELRLQAGHLHYLCSRFALAEQQLNDSLARFQACGDRRGQARTYNELAWLGHLQHQYAEATQQVEKALALLDGEDPEQAMSYRVQGMIAFNQRRWEAAEEFHRQALTLFEKQGDRRRITGSIQNLATALLGQKRFPEALVYSQQAAARLDNLVDVHSLGIVQMTLGGIYYHLSDLSHALLSYKQAGVIFNRLHDKLSIAKINTGLGLSYLALQQYKDAENAFSISIQLFAELKDESLRLNATDGLVMVYLAGGQSKQAIALAEQALHELAGMTNMPNYAYLLQSLTAHLAEARQGQGGAF